MTPWILPSTVHDRPLLHDVSAQSTNQLHVSVIKDAHWPESGVCAPILRWDPRQVIRRRRRAILRSRTSGFRA